MLPLFSVHMPGPGSDSDPWLCSVWQTQAQGWPWATFRTLLLSRTFVISPLPRTLPTFPQDSPESRVKISGSESMAGRRPCKPNMCVKPHTLFYKPCTCCFLISSMLVLIWTRVKVRFRKMPPVGLSDVWLCGNLGPRRSQSPVWAATGETPYRAAHISSLLASTCFSVQSSIQTCVSQRKKGACVCVC